MHSKTWEHQQEIEKMHFVKHLQLLSHLFNIDGMSIVYKVLNLTHPNQFLIPRIFILLCI